MVSVIVPVWNDAGCLEMLLGRLREEPGEIETLVVDGGSTDATREIARRFSGARWIDSPRGRGRQMNVGARAAAGDVLLFLHCDTLAPRGSISALPSLLDQRGADFGAFRLRFDEPSLLLRFLCRFTNLAQPCCCFGDQGIFARRSFFEATGGFPEIPLLEDVHWLRRAASMGRMTRSPDTAVTSARRFRKVGFLRQSLRNLTILIRDRLGTDPATLAKLYAKGADEPSAARAPAARADAESADYASRQEGRSQAP